MYYCEYALEIRRNGSFYHQVDVYQQLVDAEKAAKTLTLDSEEETDIVRIEYDDDGNEVSAESVY